MEKISFIRNMHRADYIYRVNERTIIIEDLDKGNRSVTNDAEQVIADIVAEKGHLTGYRIFYRDSEGMWDELLVKDDQFAGFAPLQKSDEEFQLFLTTLPA